MQNVVHRRYYKLPITYIFTVAFISVQTSNMNWTLLEPLYAYKRSNR